MLKSLGKTRRIPVHIFTISTMFPRVRVDFGHMVVYSINMMAETPMEGFDRIPCLCAALRTATRAVSRLYNEEIHRAGIEGNQLTLLRMLAAMGPVNQLKLGRSLASEKTTMSRNLRLLEKKGWIQARPGGDRRSRIIEITDPGRKQMVKALPQWERAQTRLKKAMTSSHFDELLRLLPQVSQAALEA